MRFPRKVLPAADKLHDLELRSRSQPCSGPIALVDNALIELHRNPLGGQIKLAKQLMNSEFRPHLASFPIHSDRHGPRCCVARHNSSFPVNGIIVNVSGCVSRGFPNMPTTYAETYFPVLIQILIALAVAGGMIGASAILGRKVRDRVKDSPYESGMNPVGDARERFSVKFYLVGMVFILFDIEAIFLYPWAVVYRELKMFAFTEMLLFIVLVLCGFFYIWKKGVLNWAVEDREETPSPAEVKRAA